jgi:preprotein translocase subunit YajC
MTFANTILIAQAAAPAGQPGGLFGNPMVFMILMMVMMYFILIRPQRKKQKDQEALQKALAAGDEVVTIGGAHGVVATVKEKTVVVKFTEGKVEFDRTAISFKKAKADGSAVVDLEKK